jgi:N-glycosylase/DNA lyase
MNELQHVYKQIKPDIDNRLNEFAELWENGSNKDIFREMAFCMCTPQTKAQKAWKGVSRLYDLDYFDVGSIEEISFILKEAGVRFHQNKAKYILKNKNRFLNDAKEEILQMMNGDTVSARNILAHSVIGYGLKEASHLLRNVGFGSKICILDRHILRQLNEYGVISKIPQVVTEKLYLEIENDMKHFAKEIKIPVDALDFVFWHQAHNEIFK